MNALVEFIKRNENWQELLSNAPYNLSIKEDGLYTIFSYNQNKSDFSLAEVQVACGLILRIRPAFQEIGAGGLFTCPAHVEIVGAVGKEASRE